MDTPTPFKWRHFEAEIILLCVRYPLSYRHLEEMMHERGLRVDHTTIYRWVQHYPLNWTGAAERISKLRPLPGALMRPT